VIILWGRNPKNSNKHLLPFLKDKKIIVIDPIKTDMAKDADLHLQIRPRRDIYLSIMLSRLALLEGCEDKDFCKKRCNNFDDYVDFVSSYTLIELEKLTDISLLEAAKLMETIRDKKVSILVGIGVQKYKEGSSVLRGIDGFGALMGLFGKEGSGVTYLSDSTFGLENPFKTKRSDYLKANVDFSKFGIVFVSNANPLSQMPNTSYVKSSFEKAKFKVYFGLWDNETSKICDLVIPAASFLEKKDIKTSYSHENVYEMPKIEHNENALSEYEFAQKMFDLFGLNDLKSEDEYLDIFRSNIKDGKMSHFEQIPYKDKFYTESGKFEFIDEFEKENEDSNDFYLLSSRQIGSLNSQFDTDDTLYVPNSLNLLDGDEIELTARDISCKFKVKNLDGLRDDCMMLNSGAKNSNIFTKSMVSYEADMALYQDFKVSKV
jgi:anaerobic selenocysteine-containing dehydrogenase